MGYEMSPSILSAADGGFSKTHYFFGMRIVIPG